MTRRDRHLQAILIGVAVMCGLVMPPGCEAQSDSPGSAKPNVLLLVVDALRPDHLGCYGYNVPTSPNIDQVAAEGIVFETAVTHAPWTKSAFSSMLTSLYPFQHGVSSWSAVMPDSIETLPQVLKRAGYSTGCVMNTVALTGRFKILKGFDEIHVVDKEDRDAFKTSEDAIDLIEQATEPFMLMVHYSDVHSPYRPPLKYLDAVRGDSDLDPLSLNMNQDTLEDETGDQEYRAKVKMLYDGCVLLADDGVGEILRYLGETGLRERTLVIITADHGEAFWEHGRAFHAGSVYDEVVRVPLIMSWPGVLRAPARIPHQVRHVDIFPTVASAAGAIDRRHREGMDLVELVLAGTGPARGERLLPPHASLCECTTPRAPATRCIRLDDWKLIVESITATRELYNLRDDPGETVDLAGQGLAIEDSLEGMIAPVRGVRLGGWRLSFGGADPESPFEVTVSLPKGRFASVERFARSQADRQVDMGTDSTYFSFHALGKDLNPMLFDTKPRNAEIQITIDAGGAAKEAAVRVGSSDRKAVTERLRLRPGQALGLPHDFIAPRSATEPAVFVWWLPGESIAAGEDPSKLTPEERARLRALGYIQ